MFVLSCIATQLSLNVPADALYIEFLHKHQMRDTDITADCVLGNVVNITPY